MVPDQGQPLVPTSILLIGGDNKAADATLYGILQKAGYTVRTTEASAADIRSIETQPPDLVIIDHHNDEMRGVEICTKFNSNSQLQGVPILLVGSQNDRAMRRRAFEVGCADWLNTPANGIELLAKVQTHLDLQRLRKNRVELKDSQTEELTKAQEQAEAAVRAKNAFLSHMSHELRTPLNAILGFSRLMERNPNLTEAQSENLRLIYQSGKNLLQLINDVLEMSKIDTGNAKLDITVIDLPQLMQGVAVMFKSRAADQGLTFSLNLAPDIPSHVRCDEHKLQQIIINLLSNSLKFTRSGGIELDVRCACEATPDMATGTGSAQGPCDVTFEVRDTGAGIAAEDLERIFDPFFKARATVTSTRGTGLGLTISRNFARLMGGDITAANRKDQGACFTFRVSLEVATAGEALPEEEPERIVGIAPGSKAYRVLVVDDDLMSRMLLSELLTDVGFEVEKAEDGEKAVELFSEWMPDIVFMDMRMPVMDGLSATRHIKATDKGLQTPVIALTGQTFEKERQTILSAGCDAYLAKPLEEQQLFDLLTKHLKVEFIRKKSISSVEAPNKDAQITIGEMAQLPVPFLTELRKTALELDLEKLKGQLDQIQSAYPALGASLLNLSSNFRFEEIYNLCDGALNSKK